jgi:aquaporin Z
MSDNANHRFPWKLYLAELVGTALLVGVGLSLVIFFFGEHSPSIRLVPNAGLRRLITGFLFGTTGALIALSPVGKASGAHINPAVTLGFCLMGTMRPRVGVGYVVAQLIGATLGVLPLLAWGHMGRSVAFGATLPGTGVAASKVLLGEVVTTFFLITGLGVFLGFRKLRAFTPALFPFLYALMVFAEAPISGTSTNPARSFGPAVVSGRWDGWWIYLLGPVLGTFLGIVFCKLLAIRIEAAKLYHFDHDPHNVLHGYARGHEPRPGPVSSPGPTRSPSG